MTDLAADNTVVLPPFGRPRWLLGPVDAGTLGFTILSFHNTRHPRISRVVRRLRLPLAAVPHTPRRPRHGLPDIPAILAMLRSAPPPSDCPAALASSLAMGSRFCARVGNRKLIVFLFPPYGTRPSLVLKLPRSDDDAPRILREHQRLSRIESRLGQQPGGIPRPSALLHADHTPCLLLPYVHASPLQQLFPSRPGKALPVHLAEILDRVCDWLLAAQTACIHPVPCPSVADHALPGLLHPELVDAVRTRHLPATLQHGDFNPANILVDPSGGISIHDWEWAECPGLPLVDLFNLALRCAMLLDPVPRRRNRLPHPRHAAMAFSQPGPIAGLLARQTPRFIAALGIPPDMVRPLYHAFLDHLFMTPGERTLARYLAPAPPDGGPR